MVQKNENLIHVRVAARLYGLPIKWLRKQAEEGVIPALIADKQVLFDSKILGHWLENHIKSGLSSRSLNASESPQLYVRNGSGPTESIAQIAGNVKEVDDNKSGSIISGNEETEKQIQVGQIQKDRIPERWGAGGGSFAQGGQGQGQIGGIESNGSFVPGNGGHE